MAINMGCEFVTDCNGNYLGPKTRHLCLLYYDSLYTELYISSFPLGKEGEENTGATPVPAWKKSPTAPPPDPPLPRFSANVALQGPHDFRPLNVPHSRPSASPARRRTDGRAQETQCGGLQARPGVAGPKDVHRSSETPEHGSRGGRAGAGRKSQGRASGTQPAQVSGAKANAAGPTLAAPRRRAGGGGGGEPQAARRASDGQCGEVPNHAREPLTFNRSNQPLHDSRGGHVYSAILLASSGVVRGRDFESGQ